jgi:ATP-dependent Lhr-like helicase
LSRRVVAVRIAGQQRWIIVEDAGRYRDALGVALPVGIAEAYLEPVADPLGDLVARYARTHGPFAAATCAARFGLGVFVVEQALKRLSATGRVVSGEFSPEGAGTEWCDAEVLRMLRRRSLAALRKEIEPVPPRALAAFLPRWHQIGGNARGVDAVAASIEQVQGIAVPASAWERLVLPARVADYSPAMLDELTGSGEVVWAGTGSLAGHDGWVTLAYADSAPLLLPPPDDGLALTPMHQAVLDALDDGQALFFRSLSDRVGSTDDAALAAVVWDLVWAGQLTNDTFAPVRALLGGSGAHRAKAAPARTRYRRPGRPGALGLPGGLGRPAMPSRSGPPAMAGRWSRLPDRDLDPTRRAAALADLLLERHGVVTRGAVMAEGVVGGFAAVYPVLGALEERGAARRGYFVEGLGAAQFAVPGAVDRLRTLAEPAELGKRTSVTGVVLAATDPANPYGAALPWPDRVVDSGDGEKVTATGHRAGRKAGALVVLVGGELVLYVERGGRTLLSFVDDPEALIAAGQALGAAVRTGALGPMSVERADGESVHSSPLRDALTAAGFRATPRGLRLRG